MINFAKEMDSAFYLNTNLPERTGTKFWYTLFQSDWILGVKETLLKNKQISAKKIALSLYWYKSFNDSDELVKYFKSRFSNEEAYESFFFETDSEIIFSEATIPERSDLFSQLNGESHSEAYTINIDQGSFLKKTAGDLSGAPYSQTLYANTNLKKIFSIYDFDFINHFKLKKTTSKVFDKVSGFSINTPLPKPFILLSGISGTGKTRFVKQQATYFKENESNYCLVPVRPDWQEPSDLLGYISRLGNNGSEYIVTDFLLFIVAAWKHITEHIDGDDITFKDNAVPYWLCLDEMNLAPVEQYFADYLSVIETRYWEDGQYRCAPLLNASVFTKVADISTLRSSLKLKGNENTNLWNYFLKQGISIPPNLIVAGTVNMDETTHGFSRKVIDRAFTLDFGEFFPNDYLNFFEPETRVKALSFPTLSQVDLALMSKVSIDADAKKSIGFLDTINAELKGTPFELAYRALNELLIAVVCFEPDNEIALQAVWDDFLMTKVLPRIEGDSEKLQDDGEHSLLNKLESVLMIQLADIWELEVRPDLLRENIDGTVLNIPCRSKKKINWMNNRLSDNGFTSFWP